MTTTTTAPDPEAPGPAPFLLQVARLSWAAPVITSYAAGFVRNASPDAPPAVVILSGIGIVLANLLGLGCGAAGLLLAKRHPAHRAALLRNSGAGLAINLVCALLIIGGFVDRARTRATNVAAMKRFLELPRTPGLEQMDPVERYALIAREMRVAAETSRKDQSAVFDTLADGMETLLDPMRAHVEAWDAFNATGGLDAATMADAVGAVQERRRLLISTRGTSERFAKQLADVKTAWSLMNAPAKVLPKAERELLIANLLSTQQAVVANDIAAAGEMDSLLELLETTFGKWQMEAGGLAFEDPDHEAEYQRRFARIDEVLASRPVPPTPSTP